MNKIISSLAFVLATVCVAAFAADTSFNYTFGTSSDSVGTFNYVRIMSTDGSVAVGGSDVYFATATSTSGSTGSITLSDIGVTAVNSDSLNQSNFYLEFYTGESLTDLTMVGYSDVVSYKNMTNAVNEGATLALIAKGAPTPAPEPTSGLLLLVGGALLGLRRKRRVA